MAINLGKEEPIAKEWIKKFIGYANGNRGSYPWWNTDVQPLYQEILNRNFTFLNEKLDNILAYCTRFRSPKNVKITRQPSVLAVYIAWFCEQLGIMWDCSTHTTMELDSYINGSVLAKTLYENGLWSNSPAPQQKAQRTTGKNGGAPASDYKSSGPHSADVPNLVGAANSKITLNGTVYCIEADKVGKNTPNAFITPLKVSPTGSGIVKVSVGQAETVKMGSGNGWTDCKLWFDSKVKADAFLGGAQNLFGSKFTNIHVSQAKADSNGYYEVSTEFGNAYIKANKLNECIGEALENVEESCETCEEQAPIARKDSIFARSKALREANSITDLDAYNDGYFHGRA